MKKVIDLIENYQKQIIDAVQHVPQIGTLSDTLKDDGTNSFAWRMPWADLYDRTAFISRDEKRIKNYLKRSRSMQSRSAQKLFNESWHLYNQFQYAKFYLQNPASEEFETAILYLIEAKEKTPSLLKKLNESIKYFNTVSHNRSGKTLSNPEEVCRYILGKLNEGKQLSRADDMERHKTGKPLSAYGIAAKHFKLGIRTVKTYWSKRDIK